MLSYPNSRLYTMNESKRFWAKVDKSGECWEWTAFTLTGYGRFRVGGKEGHIVSAHRFAYEELVGPIPAGLQLDHLCRNRACVNPDHLEPVTQRENLRRGEGWAGRNARKTHCPRGHEYNEANTYVDSIGRRYCRTCDRENHRAKATRERVARQGGE